MNSLAWYHSRDERMRKLLVQFARTERPSISLIGFICLTLLIAFAIGCGRIGSGRVIVSGNVTYAGQPVSIGQIRFIPQQGTIGPLTISIIKDGSYSSKATGGVPVGEHRVEILSFDPEEYANAPIGPGTPPPKQLLPSKYNNESTLSASIDATHSTKTINFALEE